MSDAQQPVRSTDLLERKGYNRLWRWFEISRAGWLTIPRVLLHEMPDEWQDKMAELLEEYQQTFTNWPEGIGTRAQITDCGHLTSCYNWLHNYRHPAKGKIDTLRSNAPASATDGRTGSARICPKCGIRAHADRCAVCLDQPLLAKEVPCPDCYAGHLRPCQVCGDSGVALLVQSPNAPASATGKD